MRQRDLTAGEVYAFSTPYASVRPALLLGDLPVLCRWPGRSQSSGVYVEPAPKGIHVGQSGTDNGTAWCCGYPVAVTRHVRDLDPLRERGTRLRDVLDGDGRLYADLLSADWSLWLVSGRELLASWERHQQVTAAEQERSLERDRDARETQARRDGLRERLSRYVSGPVRTPTELPGQFPGAVLITLEQVEELVTALERKDPEWAGRYR